MKKINYLVLAIIISFNLYGQTEKSEKADSTKIINLQEIVVTANKQPILLKNNPGSISLVTQNTLATMPKSQAIEEALRLTPGVKVDNQHNAERVHISIRGQGILTERGLRGIGVLIDGIPVNDPSGFAPDLYDVDWSTVNKIEVLRGPAVGLYGAGSSGGVINIFTNDGGNKPFGGEVCQHYGSNGFYKSFLQLNGKQNIVDYRISFSRSAGDGYREHQAFWTNKLYEKINFYPTDKLSIKQIVSYTEYFQQNPEGLNITQFNDLRQANPDARPFNEYQKTIRTTVGIIGKYNFSDAHNIETTTYIKSGDYKETSNKCAEYRDIKNPGVILQYNYNINFGEFKNTVSTGLEYKHQKINMYKLASEKDTNRVESVDEYNLETDSLLANQIITQQSNGIYALYKLGYKKFNLMASLRYDEMYNKLLNKMYRGDTATTSKNFSQFTYRAGASYNFNDFFTLFINWSKGFIPPSTEELASNPVGYSGFNIYLIPATSNCIDVGWRGFWNKKLYYEITTFFMKTQNDFFRFKQRGRGNQEVFYGNAGNSERKGIETYISYDLLKDLSFQVAYTFADYKYTSATINPVYTDTAYVLTNPPAPGQRLPNSPQHQLYGEINYSIKNFKISLGTEYQSEWAIYTDAKAYNGELDPTIYKNWQEGFTLFNAKISYEWKIKNLKGECSIAIRNITNEKYMAFTEPDPDGNSYHPGPAREIFGCIKVKF
ncbi:MAG: TonB-dependent receptor [Bacteroidales bacterium]|nr:TonB-dependent receptor [Bacteroidales bacterium]